MEVPQIWTRVPYGAEPLREEVLPQRNAPGRCCREGNEFGKPGPGGPKGAGAGCAWRNKMLLLTLKGDWALGRDPIMSVTLMLCLRSLLQAYRCSVFYVCGKGGVEELQQVCSRGTSAEMSGDKEVKCKITNTCL